MVDCNIVPCGNEIKAIWSVINWAEVAKNYAAAKK
jgi:superoxide dismutase